MWLHLNWPQEPKCYFREECQKQMLLFSVTDVLQQTLEFYIPLPASLWATVNRLASFSSTLPRHPPCEFSSRFRRSAMLWGRGASSPFLARNLTSTSPVWRSPGLDSLFLHSSSPLFFNWLNLEIWKQKNWPRGSTEFYKNIPLFCEMDYIYLVYIYLVYNAFFKQFFYFVCYFCLFFN